MRGSVLSSWLLLAVASFLVACGAVRYSSSYPPPPESFAAHDTSHPFFDLHWNLERDPGRVVVQGIVTASRADAIQDVTVEVVGLDAEGNAVSRALGTTYGRRMSRGQSRPFFIRLRPSGRETTFQVRVWHFRWEIGNGGNGSKG